MICCERFKKAVRMWNVENECEFYIPSCARTNTHGGKARVNAWHGAVNLAPQVNKISVEHYTDESSKNFPPLSLQLLIIVRVLACQVSIACRPEITHSTKLYTVVNSSVILTLAAVPRCQTKNKKKLTNSTFMLYPVAVSVGKYLSLTLVLFYFKCLAKD